MNALHFSLGEKLALYFQGGAHAFFLSFLIIGPLAFQLGGGEGLVKEIEFEYGEVAYARGYITRVLETDKTEDGFPVFQYDYSFPLGLEKVYGTSYSNEFYYEDGNRIQIQYLVNDPQTSRLDGVYYTEFVFLAVLGVATFLIGLFSVPLRLRSIRHKQQFLQDGVLTNAHFEAVRATGTEIEEEDQYKLTYSYTVGDKGYYISRKTIDPYGKDKDEYLVYSKVDHTDVKFLSDLPYSVAKRVKAYHRPA